MPAEWQVSDDAPLRFLRVAGRFATADVILCRARRHLRAAPGRRQCAPVALRARADPRPGARPRTGTVSLGALESNPAYRAVSVLRGGGWQTLLLWAVIAAVVLVLDELTLKLARQEGAEPG